MAIHRIYHPEALETGLRLGISGNAATHVARVLRLSVGDEITLFNGRGDECVARLETVRGDSLQVLVGEVQAVNRESPLRSTLLQGICRGQKMDFVVQKATELGVSEIQPLSCDRSVVRLTAERAMRRRDHWQKVAIGAAEQCGRTVVPEVGQPLPLNDAVARLPVTDRKLMLDPLGEGRLPLSAEPLDRIVLLIGPEGGLSPAEREFAQGCGFSAVRLGPRILRTETASLVALSLLQYLQGDLDGRSGSGRLDSG